MQSVYLALAINWWNRWQHVSPLREAVESAVRDHFQGMITRG
jgi:hypothetical protein